MTLEDMLQLCQSPNIDPSCPDHTSPSGQISLDPEAYTMLPITILISTISSILVVTAMSIRIFTRFRLLHQFAIEDVLMVIATIGFFGFLGALFSSAPYGLGKHMWDITLSQALLLLHRVYAGQILYCFHMYPAKLAVVLQVKHIFTSSLLKREFLYWACWATIALLTSSYVSILFICVFPCVPIRKAWGPAVEGWCMDRSLPGITGAMTGLVTDLVVLVLPVIGVAGLQMPRRQKIAVAAVFAVGVFACTTSAIRLNFTLDTHLKDDTTYWFIVQATCAIAESAAVMLCCCFPVFPRFWKYIIQHYDVRRARYHASGGQIDLGTKNNSEQGIVGAV
ncbi:hypothetical protein T440DRAFT_538617 [Plenodomus tracheiphilus IPT5]|uniref:Rhodopsin domain-containing protein n=1 Tax=Plenodomus tracheiphilus IPT5 TaxID=1408161 RepID=A0A6A7AW53_9PLEO|nr:hypothetical protein T440DRAFT_538617 [Plenodomus tracheiphilus IPT5]